VQQQAVLGNSRLSTTTAFFFKIRAALLGVETFPLPLQVAPGRLSIFARLLFFFLPATADLFFPLKWSLRKLFYLSAHFHFL